MLLQPAPTDPLPVPPLPYPHRRLCSPSARPPSYPAPTASRSFLAKTTAAAAAARSCWFPLASRTPRCCGCCGIGMGGTACGASASPASAPSAAPLAALPTARRPRSLTSAWHTSTPSSAAGGAAACTACAAAVGRRRTVPPLALPRVRPEAPEARLSAMRCGVGLRWSLSRADPCCFVGALQAGGGGGAIPQGAGGEGTAQHVPRLQLQLGSRCIGRAALRPRRAAGPSRPPPPLVAQLAPTHAAAARHSGLLCRTE